MDQERFDGEQQDERAAILAALEPEPPYDPADYPIGNDADDGYEAGAEESATHEEDPRELLKQREAELEELRAAQAGVQREREEREAQEAQQQQQWLQQQWQAWEQAKVEALQRAESMPHREAVAFLADFSTKREQALFQWGVQLNTQIENERLTKQAHKIAADHGLPEEEVTTLVRAAQVAGNPAAMKDEAKRIKAREEKYLEKVRAVEEKVNRQKAESARQEFRRSGVNRVPQGSRPAPKNEKPGSREQLARLMGIS